jgi:amidase
MTTIEALGGIVVYDAPLMMMSNVVDKYNTTTMSALSSKQASIQASFVSLSAPFANFIQEHQLGFVIERYLAIFDQPGLRTLRDLVEWNKKHADLELPPGKMHDKGKGHRYQALVLIFSTSLEQPSQAVFENGLEDNMTDEAYQTGLKHLRQSVRDSVEALWRETDTDIIVGSAESLLTTTAAVAGYPIASVPLSLSTFNGRPFGLQLVARAGAEEKLFEVMSAWEATFPDARSPPPMLLNWTSSL